MGYFRRVRVLDSNAEALKRRPLPTNEAHVLGSKKDATCEIAEVFPLEFIQVFHTWKQLIRRDPPAHFPALLKDVVKRIWRQVDALPGFCWFQLC